MAKPRTDDERARPGSDAGRCAWITQGLRCVQRGIYTPVVVGSTHLYCSWHAECLRSSCVDDRERFDRFLSFLREGLYCTVWTHYDPDVLWGSVYGEETSAKPTPCQNPSCSVRLDHEHELGYVLPHPPALPTAPLVHLLGRRLGVDMPSGNRTAEDLARLEAERERQLRALREKMR